MRAATGGDMTRPTDLTMLLDQIGFEMDVSITGSTGTVVNERNEDGGAGNIPGIGPVGCLRTGRGGECVRSGTCLMYLGIYQDVIPALPKHKNVDCAKILKNGKD
ncbi:hypothetical protein B0H17DRAFT_1130003 [Mycena rosella]|uniref:Uncharacterized protein n=1 Tax=Mycena rosella TaxID=1033263 RepID=A0AAD7GJT4_MYCRO|nr:hypothetical protein B0H17DRAFT_1130003 [Mycena rosella]